MTTVHVSAVGSWPGESNVAAQRAVFDTLAVSGDGYLGVPYLVEVPGRGPGADMIGRAAAMLTGLPVDLQPFGWRLSRTTGRDVQRATQYLTSDLDVLAEVADGYVGPLTVPVCGPWTLAANVWLPRGERVLSDTGALRDLHDSYAEGVSAVLAKVGELVPGAQVTAQLDEPSLPTVLAGRVRTVSGLGTLPPVMPSVAQAQLRTTAEHVRRGGAAVMAHCCAQPVPWSVLADAGITGVAAQASGFAMADWEHVAALVESGGTPWLGVLDPLHSTKPQSAGTGEATRVANRIATSWSDVGLATSQLSRVGITATCGAAGARFDDTETLHRRLVDIAKAVRDLARA